MKLLIVESPNKAKTITGYLKKARGEWEVCATKGHIEKLPEDEYAIDKDAEGHTTAKWVLEEGRQTLVREIANLAASAEAVFVATDDDREGEKIAADIARRARIRHYRRVVFREITEEEILYRLESNVRDLDKNIVEAAVARRISDRVIGYPMSELIRRDFKRTGRPYETRGIGRAISPALHILSTREDEIDAFASEKYRRVGVDYMYDGVGFRCMSNLTFAEGMDEHLNELLHAINTGKHFVMNYDRKTRDEPPRKPLVTASLQHGCWYLFGIKPKETMKIAQRLFEMGFITYHRTDSYRIAETASLQMREVLLAAFGPEYVISQQRRYKSRNGAQDAHEAIRPTHFDESSFPKNIREKLSVSYYPYKVRNGNRQKLEEMIGRDIKVYGFIWYRTLATQMKDAVYDDSEIEIEAGGNIFHARANRLIFDGWERLNGHMLKLSTRKEGESWRDRIVTLPEVSIGEELHPIDVEVSEHWTERPPRYGIGRFGSVLDRLGIARPSTLDTIAENLEKKGYVKPIMENKGMLVPTETGRAVDAWTTEHAPWLNDIEHARTFENSLDEIEKGDDPEELIQHYTQLVDELAQSLGIALDPDGAVGPSEAQVALARKIADKKGIEVSDEVLRDKKKLKRFLDANVERKRKVFACPQCKKGEVFEGENNYYCGEYKNGCDFFLSKKAVNGFFKRFDVPYERRDEVLSKSVTTRPVLLENLKGKKGKFDAKVVMKPHEEFGWQLALKFK